MRRSTKKSTGGPRVPRALKRLFPNVKTVTDATQPVIVDVRARDCVNGKKMDAGECAMAVAAKRQFKAQGAVIGLAYSYIVRGSEATRFKTPGSVQREIVSFDRNQDFAPGTYQLSAVWAGARLDRDRTHEKDLRDSRSRRRVKAHVHHGTVRVRALERGSVQA